MVGSNRPIRRRVLDGIIHPEGVGKSLMRMIMPFSSTSSWVVETKSKRFKALRPQVR